MKIYPGYINEKSGAHSIVHVVISVRPGTERSLVQTNCGHLKLCVVHLDKVLYLHCLSPPS